MVVACGDDKGIDSGDDIVITSQTAGDETAETAGTEDEIGDDTTTTSSTTSDDTSTSTDDTTTTTDDGCSIGSEGCECTGGGSCDPGLECMGGICTPPDTTGPDTDTNTETSETTTDTGSTVCDEVYSFEILAVDATDTDGWDPSMSMLGEGLVMAWDMQDQEAYITWDIDVPCDDTWHIWVRAIDQGEGDSFFASADGFDPAGVFELGCTAAANNYVWKELNYRDPADPTCTYLFDPWTQDWLAGIHPFTLIYRDSHAVSRIWITNSGLMP